jgi:hypothetical protein
LEELTAVSPKIRDVQDPIFPRTTQKPPLLIPIPILAKVLPNPSKFKPTSPGVEPLGIKITLITR